MSVFTSFRENDDEELVSDVHVSERHEYVFVRPGTDDLVVEYSVKDVATESGHEKLVTTQVLECGCGCLTSWDPESRLKPPAGRCQTCFSLICQRHLDEISRCSCGVQICSACRLSKDNQFYCKSCQSDR